MSMLLTIFINDSQHSPETKADDPETQQYWIDVCTIITQMGTKGTSVPDDTITVYSSSHPRVTANKPEESCQNKVGIFRQVPAVPELEVDRFLEVLCGRLMQLLHKSGGGSIECRAYRPYHSTGKLLPRDGGIGLAPTHQGVLIVNCMTPSPDSEKSFNDWYSEEHIPMLSVVPGWVSSRRYVLLGSTTMSQMGEKEVRSVPKYLALHEWVDNNGFESEEYRAATNTPWRTEVIGSVKEKQRWVLGYVGKLRTN